VSGLCYLPIALSILWLLEIIVTAEKNFPPHFALFQTRQDKEGQFVQGRQSSNQMNLTHPVTPKIEYQPSLPSTLLISFILV
jgi:hypothetical protein